jgi:hypothetical protein
MNIINKIKIYPYKDHWKTIRGKVLLTNEVRLLVAMGYKFEVYVNEH